MICRLIRPRGFCKGVRESIEMLESLALKGKVYVFKDIVHNESVLDSFRKKGVVFTRSIKDIPKGSTVVFSAHGVSKGIKDYVRDNICGQVHDATCDVLKNIHRKVQDALGDPIIYLGNDPCHDEVKAILDYGDILFVRSGEIRPDEILDHTKGKDAYLFTQTTLNTSKLKEDLKIIRQHARLLSEPTICYATKERQDALRSYPGNDLAIVVGSKRSSNSQRLYEIARENNKDACLLMDTSQLSIPSGTKTIVMTSGASTPEQDVKNIAAYLASLGFNIEETI